MTVAEGARTIADIKLNGEDLNGKKINIFYSYNPPDFGIYRSDQRVMIQFADDREQALQQRRDLAPLAPLRNEIEGLVEGWRSPAGGTPPSRGYFGLSNPARMQAKAECFDWRVSGALVQALEKDVPGGQATLEKIKADILGDRVAFARFEYLLTALATALAMMFVAWICSSLLPATGADDKPLYGFGIVALAFAGVAALGIGTANMDAPPLRAGLLFGLVAIPLFALLVWPGAVGGTVDKDYASALSLWRAASSGAVGAFFSISLAIRGRTVLPDLQRTANMMDAALRVTVGFIGGAVLMGLIDANMVQFSFGDTPRPQGAPHTALFVMIIGFVAGFSERFVPDLLEKASAKPADTPPPRASAPPAPAPAATARPSDPAAKDAASPAPATPSEEGDNEPDTDVEVGPEGFQLGDDELTQDDALPPAQGGVTPTREGGA